MRRREWLWLALSSPLAAATRPRYGGTLGVQLSAAIPSLDPSDPLADSIALARRDSLSHLVFEPLVKRNAKQMPEARLAIGWQPDAEKRRWRFTLRPRAVFHDGTPVNGPEVAAALANPLRQLGEDVTVTATPQTVLIQAQRAMPGLAMELAEPRYGVVRRAADGALTGTGPFRVTQWEAGRRGTLTAFEDHWAGRPFVDSVALTMNPSPRQVSTADVMEMPPGGTRRTVPDRYRVWVSAPVELMALVAVDAPAALCEALSLGIDRASIVNVLLQRRGEAAGGLYPQWLTGYAFLFSTATDLERGRGLAAQARPGPMILAVEPNDALGRTIAERIAVNARDVGLSLQVRTAAGRANLRLVRLRGASLREIAELIGWKDPLPDSPYDAERALVATHRIIPLVHLADVYAIHPRVRRWDQAHAERTGLLHLEDVWVEP